jgi:hypothetical protein
MTVILLLSSDGRATFTRIVRKLLVTGFILGLLLNPEDGGDMVRRNVGGLLPNYMVLQPRISHSSGHQLRLGHIAVKSRTVAFKNKKCPAVVYLFCQNAEENSPNGVAYLWSSEHVFGRCSVGISTGTPVILTDVFEAILGPSREMPI